MLHDAMLQYYLNAKPGSDEAAEFLELIKGDEAGDLVKNLAFTKSGSRLMCLALARANAKDRKLLLRSYRDTIKLLAGDVHGHAVVLTAFEVIDDTKLTSKSIFPELLCQNSTETERHADLLEGMNHLTARISLLYLFAGDKVKWLLTDADHELLEEVRTIRQETSKKDSAIRREELIKYASPTLLEFVAAEAEGLSKSSFGCQAITEILFGAKGDKAAALAAVANISKSEDSSLKESAHVGRMLKSLVQGGRFNPSQKTIERVQPPLKFADVLYEQIKDEVMTWATKSNPFVVVAMVEAEDFSKRDELMKTLRKNSKVLREVASSGGKEEKGGGPARSAAKLLLERLGNK
jgi:pumilio family protein 6